MSKILLIASAALLLCSGVLSFVNKGKLTATLEDARTAHTDAASAKVDATKARTAMTKAVADAKEAVQKATDGQTQLAPLQTQVTELESKVKAANDATAAKDKELADLNDKLKIAMGRTSTDPNAGDIAKQIDDLKREKDELQVVKDGLQTRLASAEGQVAAAAKREQDRQSGVAMVGLRGRVLAVDRNWNFVVLNIGDRSGVNNNATMIIQRGGNLVGKVRITSVEPSQSIADIIPNSVPAGISVQAGDTVVFPGT